MGLYGFVRNKGSNKACRPMCFTWVYINLFATKIRAERVDPCILSGSICICLPQSFERSMLTHVFYVGLYRFVRNQGSNKACRPMCFTWVYMNLFATRIRTEHVDRCMLCVSVLDCLLTCLLACLLASLRAYLPVGSLTDWFVFAGVCVRDVN